MTHATPPNSPSRAESFLRSLAEDILSEPRFALLSAAGAADPIGAASLASEVSALALAGARAKLEHSSAHLLFETIAVSDRAALARSVGAAFGAAPLAALLNDEQAMAALPERSQSSLSAWRFPDASIVLCARCADGSFAAARAALSACPSLLLAMDPQAAAKFGRAPLAAEGAFPCHAPAVESMLMSMAQSETQWLPGVRLNSDGKAVLPLDLLDRLRSPIDLSSSLDKALAAAAADASGSAPAQPTP